MLHHLNDLVEQWVAQWGYLGIFAAMVLENVIPPIPSEVIMPLAGFYVGQGQLNFVGAVAAGLLGTVVGMIEVFSVIVAAEGVTVRGILATNTGYSDLDDRAGILVRDTRDCLVEGNRLRDVTFGIYLRRSTGCVVRQRRANRLTDW